MADLGLLAGLAGGLERGLENYHKYKTLGEEKARSAEQLALEKILKKAQVRDLLGDEAADKLFGDLESPKVSASEGASGLVKAGLMDAPAASVQAQEGLMASASPTALPRKARELQKQATLAEFARPDRSIGKSLDTSSGQLKMTDRPLTIDEEIKRETEKYQLEKLKKELGKKEKEDVTGPATDLRKEYQAHPITKNTDIMTQAYTKITKSAAQRSAAGDIGLIYGYMRIQDPSSTVREGEFATAANAGGIPERIRAQYNKALSGTRLTDDQRNDFVGNAKVIYDGQLEQQKEVDDQYKGLAKTYGVNPKLIMREKKQKTDKDMDRDAKIKFLQGG